MTCRAQISFQQTLNHTRGGTVSVLLESQLARLFDGRAHTSTDSSRKEQRNAGIGYQHGGGLPQARGHVSNEFHSLVGVVAVGNVLVPLSHNVVCKKVLRVYLVAAQHCQRARHKVKRALKYTAHTGRCRRAQIFKCATDAAGVLYRIGELEPDTCLGALSGSACQGSRIGNTGGKLEPYTGF